MEMETSPPPIGPCSPQSQMNDGVGSISQPYRSSLMNTDEKPPKMAAGSVDTSSFQSGSGQEACLSNADTHSQFAVEGEQANLISGYHAPSNCPVGPPNNNISTPGDVDNAKYAFSDQSQCPFSGSRSSQSFSANQNSHLARTSQNQSPCPWKLSGGAKVLVSNSVVMEGEITDVALMFTKNIHDTSLNFFPLSTAGVSTQFMSRGSSQPLQPGGVGVFLPVLHARC